MDYEDYIITTLEEYCPSPPTHLALSIGDDVSCLSLSSFKKNQLIITTDQLVQDVHFKWEWCTPQDVACKLLQMNASDILAKAGKPTIALLNLQLSPAFVQNRQNIITFAQQLGKELYQHNIFLIGGDTTASQVDSFSLTLIGECESFVARTSTNIKEGDLVVLMGAVGGSSYILQQKLKKAPVSSKDLLLYTRPLAQWEAPLFLEKWGAKVSIDLSDSLFKSLQILTKKNTISLDIHIDKIPSNIPVHLDKEDSIPHLLFGGEDFAVLCIIDYQYEIEVVGNNLPISIIGKVSSKQANSVAYFYQNQILDVNNYNKNEFYHF